MNLATCAMSGCLLLISSSTEIQPSPLPVEATLDSNSLHHLTTGASFSPDGQWIAYSILRSSGRGGSGASSKYPCVPNLLLNGFIADIVVTGVTNGATKVVAGGGSYNLSPVWSPDGRYVAFASNREEQTRLELWTWEVKTGSLRKVSNTDIVPRQLQWTADSRQIVTIGVSGNQRLEKTGCRKDTGVDSKVSPDRAASASVSIYESEHTSENTSKPSSDAWSLDTFLSDLVMIDLNSGQAKVLDHGERISHFRLSSDGSQVAFTVWKRFEQPGSQQILHDLDSVVLATGRKSILARDIRLNFLGASFSWSPDGSRIAYQADGPLEDKHDCYLLNALGGGVREITGFPQGEARVVLYAPVWAANGENIYTIIDDSIWKASWESERIFKIAGVPGHHIVRLMARDDGSLWSTDGGRSATVVTNDESVRQDGIYKIDLTTGQATALLENGQRYWDVFVDGYLKSAPDGRAFLYSAQDAAQPIDLWIADERFSNPRRLTHINPQYDSYELGPRRFIHWLSLDGQTLNGVLLLPPSYREGKTYPMIVAVYGGVSTQYNDFGFVNHAPINAHLLTTRGYVVFMPDAPQHLGTPMLDLAKTVLPGVNKVIEMGIADPKRLGLMGHSYGGYSVLSLLVQTPRFVAAIESAGIGDLIGEYGEMNAQGAAFGTSITEHGQGLMGATPWEARDRFVENSPLFYLNRIETPLLIAHGSEDTNVAPFLSDEVFVGMRRLGKETVYVKYSGEGHSPSSWSYANRLDFCNRVLAWFERHLK